MRVYHRHHILQRSFGLLVAIAVKVLVRDVRRIQRNLALVCIVTFRARYVGVLLERAARAVGNRHAQRIFAPARLFIQLHGFELHGRVFCHGQQFVAVDNIRFTLVVIGYQHTRILRLRGCITVHIAFPFEQKGKLVDHFLGVGQIQILHFCFRRSVHGEIFFVLEVVTVARIALRREKQIVFFGGRIVHAFRRKQKRFCPASAFRQKGRAHKLPIDHISAAVGRKRAYVIIEVARRVQIKIPVILAFGIADVNDRRVGAHHRHIVLIEKRFVETRFSALVIMRQLVCLFGFGACKHAHRKTQRQHCRYNLFYSHFNLLFLPF